MIPPIPGIPGGGSNEKSAVEEVNRVGRGKACHARLFIEKKERHERRRGSERIGGKSRTILVNDNQDFLLGSFLGLGNAGRLVAGNRRRKIRTDLIVVVNDVIRRKKIVQVCGIREQRNKKYPGDEKIQPGPFVNELVHEGAATSLYTRKSITTPV